MNELLVARFDVEKEDFDLFFTREDRSRINVIGDDRETILFRIQTMLTLIDWAILNNRIWDGRLTEFYRGLHKKGE